MNESFKPHDDLKKLYYTYLALACIIFYLSWAIPVGILALSLSPIVTTYVISSLFPPLVAVVVFVCFWIPKFHASLTYLLTESDIIVEKGVWWKHKSIVPYNRVTNLDVIQGPLSRHFGLGKISIQTAGFSSGGGSGSTKIAEAVILGTKNFEEIKNLVMNRVRHLRPMAVEAGIEASTFENFSLQILEEIKKIRETLQKRPATA